MENVFLFLITMENEFIYEIPQGFFVLFFFSFCLLCLG